jgi:energy-coupling factor transport system ATP-binding protein
MLFAANVFDEVAFGLKNYGVPEEQIEKKVAKALSTVGLAGKEEVDPFVMTKGERQKLAVACVLACEPQVLILDEPTTGLDAKEQRAMMALLSGLNQAGHTIVIVTHTLEVAAAYARRVVLMDDGQVIADGPARDVFHKPELLAKTRIIPPPSVGLGTILGIPALTVDELASALTREAE